MDTIRLYLMSLHIITGGLAVYIIALLKTRMSIKTEPHF